MKKFWKRQEIPPRKEIQRQPIRKKSCRRIVKRDEEGRIREERFEGCSPQEIKMMKEQSED